MLYFKCCILLQLKYNFYFSIVWEGKMTQDKTCGCMLGHLNYNTCSPTPCLFFIYFKYSLELIVLLILIILNIVRYKYYEICVEN